MPVPTMKDGTMDIPFQHPLAMLYICITDCSEFAKFFWDTVNRLQGKPLRVVEDSDEIVPGRELIAHNDKKVWAIYWSVLDCGPTVLSNEDSWLTGPCFLCSAMVLYTCYVCSSCLLHCPPFSRILPFCAFVFTVLGVQCILCR